MKSKTKNSKKLARKMKVYILVLAVALAMLMPQISIAAGSSKAASNTPLQNQEVGDGEQVNLDSIKEKYWARGDETELGVVQNRTYSKKGKIDLTLYGGVLFSDPFLDIKPVGGSLGYHFSEYLSLHAVGFKYLVNPSSALLTFQQSLGATTNTNSPNYYLGGELEASLFYGKLSVLGKSIIYYDFMALGGAGVTNTESGNYITPTLGVGQRFYLSKVASVRLDYRLMFYNETLLEKQIVTRIGQPVGTRNNWSNVITLGVSFMFLGD
ncbi:MAG: outer membrane beta-barrel domain-containing protein [Bdellovibrio sp.]|nr:outer membrane beta-barrel domain-containing protein [Bdellovibrio sp.]